MCASVLPARGHKPQSRACLRLHLSSFILHPSRQDPPSCVKHRYSRYSSSRWRPRNPLITADSQRNATQRTCSLFLFPSRVKHFFCTSPVPCEEKGFLVWSGGRACDATVLIVLDSETSPPHSPPLLSTMAIAQVVCGPR